MPIVQVSILEGRSDAQKAAFASRVTEAAVDTLGVKPEQVRVLITEIDPRHWFTAGAAKSPPEKGR